MKQELYDLLRNMCDSCEVSPKVEGFIMDLMLESYQNGWDDALYQEKSNE